MSLIKTYLHEQQDNIELNLKLNEVEYIISYLEETDDVKANLIADDIRTQTYA